MNVNWVSPYIEEIVIFNKKLLNYYTKTYNDKNFDEIPKSIIVKCNSEKDVDKIAEKWELPVKVSHVGFDEYILYPLNEGFDDEREGTRTGGKTFGDVGGDDSDADWNDDADDDSWN